MSFTAELGHSNKIKFKFLWVIISEFKKPQCIPIRKLATICILQTEGFWNTRPRSTLEISSTSVFSFTLTICYHGKENTATVNVKVYLQWMERKRYNFKLFTSCDLWTLRIDNGRQKYLALNTPLACLERFRSQVGGSGSQTWAPSSPGMEMKLSKRK